MRPRHPFRHTPHTVRGTMGSPTEGPRVGGPISAHPSRGSWPHARGPIWRSTEGLNGRASFGTPLTRFVAPWGVPPKAQVWTGPFRRTLHEDRGAQPAAPHGAPPKAKMGGQVPAHPSHGSGPHRDLHRMPKCGRAQFGAPLTRIAVPSPQPHGKLRRRPQ
eukprot:8077965-Pyramimonas_sp.AAC.1